MSEPKILENSPEFHVSQSVATVEHYSDIVEILVRQLPGTRYHLFLKPEVRIYFNIRRDDIC